MIVPYTRIPPIHKCRERKFMPQLDITNYGEFLSFCETRGVKYQRLMLPPHSMKSIQCIGPWYSAPITEAILSKPVILSAEHIVMDGNTRWHMHVRANSLAIPSYRLALDFVSALHFMLEFPKAYTYAQDPTHTEHVR